LLLAAVDVPLEILNVVGGEEITPIDTLDDPGRWGRRTRWWILVHHQACSQGGRDSLKADQINKNIVRTKLN
jgi:hypothetical protein